MRYAMAVMHLSIARHFPQIMSWVPRRRRAAGPHAANDGPDTLVLARSEPAFHAWLGLNIPAGERRRYAYLAAPEDLRGFRGRVLVLPGAAARHDASDLVEAIEPRVQCGAVRWAA